MRRPSPPSPPVTSQVASPRKRADAAERTIFPVCFACAIWRNASPARSSGNSSWIGSGSSSLRSTCATSSAKRSPTAFGLLGERRARGRRSCRRRQAPRRRTSSGESSSILPISTKRPFAASRSRLFEADSLAQAVQHDVDAAPATVAPDRVGEVERARVVEAAHAELLERRPLRRALRSRTPRRRRAARAAPAAIPTPPAAQWIRTRSPAFRSREVEESPRRGEEGDRQRGRLRRA